MQCFSGVCTKKHARGNFSYVLVIIRAPVKRQEDTFLGLLEFNGG